MGGYNAIRLSKILKPAVLILSVPAVYHPAAYSVPFGPDFSRIIRQERSWEESDAWDILSTFEGHLLILAGGQDEVIPREVPERLYTCASRASSRQLKLFPDAGHHVVRYLENSPQEFDVLIALVRTLSTAPNAALKTDDL